MGKLLGALIVEFVGTFALTFVGVCAIVLTAVPNTGANLLTVALAHGLILSVIVTAGMHISGAAYNPAVTIALLTTGHVGLKKALGYIIAQCAGAIVAAGIINYVLSPLTTADGAGSAIDVTNLGATMGSMHEAMPIFILEAIATFFLMFAIMGSAVDSRGTGNGAKVGGFAIGLTVAANILAIGPLTGASMNPARTLGPMVFEGGARTDYVWVYFVAPVVGAVIAAQVWKNFLRLPAPGKSDE